MSSAWVAPDDLILPLVKFNPNHDQVGRFASADGGSFPSPHAGDGDKVGATARYRQTLGAKQKMHDAVEGIPNGELFVGGKQMTDDEFAKQADYVEYQLAAHGADNLNHAPKSTHISQDFKAGVEGQYNDHRRSQQNQIWNEYRERADTVPSERKAIIMGGLGGAGKSTMIRRNAQLSDSVASKLGIKFASYDEKGNGVGDPTNFLILNPDDIKETMAKMGMAPKIDHLSPMEGSPFIHEEASALIKKIGAEAAFNGKNIIWDITMHSEKNALKYVRQLKQEGYHVSGAFMDVPIQQSLSSAAKRHREGQNRYNQGMGEGGRVVPRKLITGAIDPSGMYRSINRAAFQTMTENGDFDHTVLMDNTDYAAKFVSETGKDGVGHRPELASLLDAHGKGLKVGDIVHHVEADPASAVTGSVEEVPGRWQDGKDRNKLAVYWTGHGAAYRSKHEARHLVKVSDNPGKTPDQRRMAERSRSIPTNEQLGSGSRTKHYGISMHLPRMVH